jgi:predicted PurR-regulated permease PerM
MNEKEMKKYFAILLLIILAIFLGSSLINYVGAFFGALILFYLFEWLFKAFVKKAKFSKPIAAILVILITLILIIVPAYLFVNATYNEIDQAFQNKEEAVTDLNKVSDFLKEEQVASKIVSGITDLGKYIETIAIKTFESVTHLLISMTIMFFILYYLLIHAEEVDKKFISLIPFNLKNSKKLVSEFKNVTYSTVISTGLIAIMQGTLMAIGFMIFGLKGALFWGFVTAILSFLPIVGPPIVWLPAVIILAIRGNIPFAIGMLIWGEVLSNLDNFIRPHLQRKIGRIHPLITLLGIIIGIPAFGLFGLIIGPLLFSYFILAFNMYREEYFDHSVKIAVFTQEKKKRSLLLNIGKKRAKKR